MDGRLLPTNLDLTKFFDIIFLLTLIFFKSMSAIISLESSAISGTNFSLVKPSCLPDKIGLVFRLKRI